MKITVREKKSVVVETSGRFKSGRKEEVEMVVDSSVQ
jgi:hypothetical protein